MHRRYRKHTIITSMFLVESGHAVVPCNEGSVVERENCRGHFGHLHYISARCVQLSKVAKSENFELSLLDGVCKIFC